MREKLPPSAENVVTAEYLIASMKAGLLRGMPDTPAAEVVAEAEVIVRIEAARAVLSGDIKDYDRVDTKAVSAAMLERNQL